MEQPTTPPPMITMLAVRGRLTAAGCYQIAIAAAPRAPRLARTGSVVHRGRECAPQADPSERGDRRRGDAGHRASRLARYADPSGVAPVATRPGTGQSFRAEHLR